jgi:excinuclease ABC subunit B
VNGRAIMYADRMTRSMQACIDETGRRREIQREYNTKHGITPQTIQKSIEELMLSTQVADARESIPARMAKVSEPKTKYADEVNLEEWAKILEQQMRDASARLDFERAALLRDELLEIRVKLGQPAET